MSPHLSHADAIVIAKRGRKLLRAGRLTHRQLTVLDCLLWCCRNPAGQIVVSYRALMRLCHVSRDTVAGAVAALQRLGLLTRIKRRVRVLWGGSIASRQLPNAYVLHPAPCTESGGPTVDQSESNQIYLSFGCTSADRAGTDLLTARRRAFEGRMPTNKVAAGMA